ncbi:MAG: hypothetical protein QF864_08240 [SAR202 cluster bacterium]|jgi:hypothetical protein|nr:hypothetical protein [SAR202 cluster bacterium]
MNQKKKEFTVVLNTYNHSYEILSPIPAEQLSDEMTKSIINNSAKMDWNPFHKFRLSESDRNFISINIKAVEAIIG